MCEREYSILIIDDDEVSINMLQFELEKYPNLVLAGVAKTGNSGPGKGNSYHDSARDQTDS